VTIIRRQTNCFFFALSLTGLAYAGPLFHSDSAAVDLGRVPEGITRDVVFNISNPGDQPLQISIPTVPCACIVMGEQEFTIPPGETHPLVMKFDSLGFSGKTSRTIAVTTNAANYKLMQLEITADVYELFKLDAGKHIKLGYLQAEETAKQTIGVGSECIDLSSIAVGTSKETANENLIVSVSPPNVPATQESNLVLQKGVGQTITTTRQTRREVDVLIRAGTKLGPAKTSVIVSAVDPQNGQVVRKEIEFEATVVDPHIDVQEICFGFMRLNPANINPPQRTLKITSKGLSVDSVTISDIPTYIQAKKSSERPECVTLSLAPIPDQIKKIGVLRNALTVTYQRGATRVRRQIPLSLLIIPAASGGST
jgi:hypothetical protein